MFSTKPVSFLIKPTFENNFSRGTGVLYILIQWPGLQMAQNNALRIIKGYVRMTKVDPIHDQTVFDGISPAINKPLLNDQVWKRPKIIHSTNECVKMTNVDHIQE